MDAKRQLPGGLALALGIIGTLACLAGLVGTWVLSHRLQNPVTSVAEKVTSLCARVETRTVDATEHIQSSRDTIRDIDQRVQERVTQQLDLSDQDVAKINELHDQLRSVITQARDWIAFSGAAVDLVRHLFDIANSTIGFITADSAARADLATALQNGNSQVEEAMALLAQGQERLDDIRANRDVAGNTSRLQSLSMRIDASLGNLQGYAETFASGVAEIDREITDLASRIRRAIRAGALLFTVILLWIAAGQISLALHGLRFIRSD